MTQKKTVIFAAVVVAAITVVGFNTAYADAYPADEDYYYWYVEDHKNLIEQLDVVERAWKVGIISDSDYFYSLVDLWNFEMYMLIEFYDFDWDESSLDSTDYIKNVVTNPIAKDKIEALIASK